MLIANSAADFFSDSAKGKSRHDLVGEVFLIQLDILGLI